MKKIALTSLLAVFAVSAASAATSPYVAAHVGYVAPTVTVYNNHANYGTFLNDDFAYDFSFAAGVKHDLGSAFALRGEVEYDLKTGLTYHIEGEEEGNHWAEDVWMRSHTLLFNGYIDMKTASALTPYVGAGLGYQWNHMNDGDKPHAFAWQVGAGVSYALCDHLSLDLGYRYLSSADKMSGEDGTKKFHTAYHQFRLGAAYAF